MYCRPNVALSQIRRVYPSIRVRAIVLLRYAVLKRESSVHNNSRECAAKEMPDANAGTPVSSSTSNVPDGGGGPLCERTIAVCRNLTVAAVSDTTKRCPGELLVQYV